MGKKLCLVVASIILFAGVPALAAPQLPDVVAVVNGEKITREQLISALIDWQSPMVLEEMIGYLIIGQEARKAGIQITEAQIKEKIEEIKKNMRPGQDFEESLKQMGLTHGHLFSLVKKDMQTEAVLRKMVELSDEDFAEYRRASHILIATTPSGPPSGPPTEPGAEPEDLEQKAKEQIEQIAQEIKDGLPFDEAAKKYSQDPGSKDNGGDLDYFTKGQMTPDFESAVFAMELGETSEPIKTMYGYHIIKVTGLGEKATGEDRKKIEDALLNLKMSEKHREWRLQVQNAADIDNKLSPKKPEPVTPATTRTPRAPRTPRDLPPAPPVVEPAPSEMPPAPPAGP